MIPFVFEAIICVLFLTNPHIISGFIVRRFRSCEQTFLSNVRESSRVYSSAEPWDCVSGEFLSCLVWGAFALCGRSSMTWEIFVLLTSGDLS
ncbi:uncharacterized protein F4812DRAFT_388148 [Daldinia caldariorum]|uniref:uncharacterized protein n=1 Tax=Daldinia caldariorum TaxID=326644 RepID=UPI002007F959|nr:uncharacterized protein F4812DRAFT_388148 [Daldinia caldariorum]KAI1468041.1 hypothetical protein F4812DRAFT_388148 [Daldinia caldariorum]